MEAQEGLFQQKAPLLNPNEPDARMVDIFILPGQPVKKGSAICVLETTKSATDIAAEADGYLVQWAVAKGQRVTAGQLLCMIANSPEAAAAASAAAPLAPAEAELQITEPAKKLAEELGVKLEDLPRGRLVTTAMVREAAQGQTIDAGQKTVMSQPSFDATKLVLYGGGGHAAKVIDLIRLCKTYTIAGILDDGLPAGKMIQDIPVLGGRELLRKVLDGGIRLAINAVAGLDRIEKRMAVFELLARNGFGFPTIIHPSAVIDPSATLGMGVQVFANAFIEAQARVGFGSIISSGAIVSHHCVLEDCAHLTPGAVLAGGVRVGMGAMIGMGVTVNMGATIGEGARIGNGARINGNVPAGTVVHSGTTWPS